jgi:hypothetical protein
VETGDPDIPDGDIGSVINPCVWARETTEPGTSAVAYRLFVEHVLNTYNVHDVFETLFELLLKFLRSPKAAFWDEGEPSIICPKTWCTVRALKSLLESAALATTLLLGDGFLAGNLQSPPPS